MTTLDVSLGAVDQEKVDELLDRVRTAIRFGNEQRRLAVAIDLPDAEALVFLAERVDRERMYRSAKPRIVAPDVGEIESLLSDFELFAEGHVAEIVVSRLPAFLEAIRAAASATPIAASPMEAGR